ncbi:MAG: replicative DNA helicase [Desulfovibrionaceae bacterium]|nr:replicative DNA helicase [Desulfovibrionaceae bacterium]
MQENQSSQDASRGAYNAPRPFKKQDTAANAQQNIFNRVPPNNLQAEMSVLAAALTNDPETVASVIATLKDGDDFYDSRHRAIFQAILSLYRADKPIDVTTVNNELHILNLWEQAGGLTYLSEIAKVIISAAYGEHYAKIVHSQATQRRLINSCAKIIEKSYTPVQDIKKLLDEAEQEIFMLSQNIDKIDSEPVQMTLRDIFSKLATLSQNKSGVTGVTTGFEQLDSLTAGLQPSDLIIIAARPAMGKTAFALSLALNAAKAGTAVAIFSLEMSREQLVKRMLAIKAHVSMSSLRQPSKLTDADWQHLYEAADDIDHATNPYKIYIDDTAYLSTIDLRARVRRLKSKHDIGLLIIDYLQLMHSPRGKDSRELEISDISRTLKAIAKDLNIPVIALSQLNRKVEERGRDDKRPQLSDLRESGAIEQDADIIMFIYRDDVYKYKKASDRPPVGVAEIIIGKQRNGPTGIAFLTFLSEYTAFENQAADFQYQASEDGQV